MRSYIHIKTAGDDLHPSARCKAVSNQHSASLLGPWLAWLAWLAMFRWRWQGGILGSRTEKLVANLAPSLMSSCPEVSLLGIASGKTRRIASGGDSKWLQAAHVEIWFKLSIKKYKHGLYLPRMGWFWGEWGRYAIIGGTQMIMVNISPWVPGFQTEIHRFEMFENHRGHRDTPGWNRMAGQVD